MFEFKMAWRETRPSWKRFLFVIAAIALGVAALTGLKGFSRALSSSIYKSARDLLAADMAVRTSSIPNPNEIRILESLTRRGAELTRTTETLSMVSRVGSSNPILSQIRAVDPGRYPFYGKVELEPPSPLGQKLTEETVVASRDLLVRSGASIGDKIQIGSAQLRISAVLKSEPDRINFGMDLGPRILITHAALERSGLIQFGSRASESFLYRLPARGLDLDEARSFVQSAIKRRVRIADYRDPNPSVTRGLKQAADFLSLMGLLSLLVAGLGVATTIHTYLQQKLDGIAILKCLGGRSKQILKIYLIQGLGLGVLGSAIGTGLGYVVQLVLPAALGGLINLPTNLDPAPGAAIQGFSIGIFITFIFLISPLLMIRKVRPSRLFLREMPETRQSLLAKFRTDPVPPASYLFLLAGIGIAASWLAGSWRWGFSFLAALLGCLLVLATVARIILAALKHLPRVPSVTLRHGIKNLNRPGTYAGSIVAALGMGVAFILTIYYIQSSLIAQIIRSAPPDFPNVFLLGVTGNDRQAVSDFMERRPEIGAHALIPSVSSRLMQIDGRPADQMDTEAEEGRRYSQVEFTLTWSQSMPPNTRITEGFWWRPPYSAPLISVGENAARHLKLHIGSILEFDAGGKTVRGKVASIRDTEFSRPGTSNQFIFSPGALDGLPTSYIGTARIPDSRVAEFQSSLFRRFPHITSIDIGQVLARVQGLLDKVSRIIRFVALFAIFAGIIILASAVVSTRYQRIREVVLLKTLGATRSQVARIQAAEFLVLGSAAGLIGGLLAAVAAHYLLGELLHTEFEFRWIPLLSATVAAAAASIATGWLASRGVLRHKPLEVLREN